MHNIYSEPFLPKDFNNLSMFYDIKINQCTFNVKNIHVYKYGCKVVTVDSLIRNLQYFFCLMHPWLMKSYYFSI